MTVENITINQDIISEEDVSISANIHNEIVSVMISDIDNYYHKLIRKAVAEQGLSCCENEDTYNKILLMANDNPVVFTDPA